MKLSILLKLITFGSLSLASLLHQPMFIKAKWAVVEAAGANAGWKRLEEVTCL